MSKQDRIVVIASAIALAAASRAHAAPEETSDDARTLFYEARGLMQRGNYAEACPKLQESLRIDAGIGTQFNLADCNENVGKIATAWAGFIEVAARAKAASQAERERIAKQRAAALEPRLPRLIIDVEDAPPGLAVTRDGVALDPVAWGAPIAIDPGRHHLAASAPGREPWTAVVTAHEGETTRVTVRALAVSRERAPAVPAAPDFPAPLVERSSAQRPVGLIALAAGATSVAVGVGFGLSSMSKRDEARGHCAGDLCDATGVALRDEAIAHGTVSTITTIAGAAAVVGGLVLVLTAPKRERRVGLGSLRASPRVATAGTGLSLAIEGALP